MSESKGLSLYQISEEMDSIMTMLIEDEVDQEEFNRRFSDVKVQFSDKMMACRHMVHKWEGYSKMIDEEVARLRAVKEKYDGARSSILGRVRGILEKDSVGKFVDPKCGLGFRLQKNSGPKIEVHDLDALEQDHPECVRITVERVASKTAIRELYKNKGVVPEGVEITEGNHVRVI